VERNWCGDLCDPHLSLNQAASQSHLVQASPQTSAQLMKKITFLSILSAGLLLISAISVSAQAVAGKWKLDALVVESDMLYAIDLPITLNILGTGEISGNTGCRDFIGKYSFVQPEKPFKTPRKITFSEITLLDPGAKEDCGRASSTETAFIESLRSAATVVFENGELVIQNKATSIDNGKNKIVIQNTMAFVRDDSEVLCDFREAEIPCQWGELDENGTNEFYSLEASKAESDRVLNYLFGKERNKDLQISSKFSGSFTKPNVKETLYYVSCRDNGPAEIICTEPFAGWIAIYDGKKMKRKIRAALGTILLVADINGDGKSEILSAGELLVMGVTTMNGELGQISGSEYQTIFPKGDDVFFGSYEQIDADKCIALATVVSVDQKNRLQMFAEEYFKKEGCDQGSTWKRIKKEQFDAELNETP
jgi:heat shock protein HslJ